MTDRNTAALLNALRDPAILVDRERRVVSANRRAHDLFGKLASGVDLAMSVRHPGVLDAVREVLDGAERKETILTQSVPHQQVFDVHVAALASGRRDGARALCSLHDVTVAHEAERMRADFVANVSHELRSPLSSLIGFIETLKGSARGDSKAQERFLDIMDGESKRMARIVDDLLSLSRVEASEHIAPTGSVAIGALMAEVIDSVRPRAAEKDMTIATNLPTDTPIVPGDRDELIEVFHNLIDNAIKYGSAGTQVEIGAETRDRIPDIGGQGIAISISNRGEVIAPEHLPRLTERFYRIDAGRSRDIGGTGLGLAIVKHIINHHRGRLMIQSSADQGNTFTIFLPVKVEDTLPPSLS